MRAALIKPPRRVIGPQSWPLLGDFFGREQKKIPEPVFFFIESGKRLTGHQSTELEVPRIKLIY